MKLISEEIESVDILTEEKDGKKTLYIQGPFLQAEVVNRNKRCYPLSTMMGEVKRYNEEFVSRGRALGELGLSLIHISEPTRQEAISVAGLWI